MRNIHKLTILLIIACFVAFFGYKSMVLYFYDVDFSDFAKGLTIKETKTMKHIEFPEDDYLIFNNIKVKNHIEEFQPFDTQVDIKNHIKYVFYNSNNDITASFWMSQSFDTYTEIFNSDLTVYGADNRFMNLDRTNILENKDIDNDIELIQYLVDTKNEEYTIFTNSKEVKENYALQFFASVVIPKVDNITLINGDYTGYILNFDNIRECSILYKNKRYIFTFYGLEYFDDNVINEIISSLIIS